MVFCQIDLCEFENCLSGRKVAVLGMEKRENGEEVTLEKFVFFFIS